jgi:hypothetical protein
MEMKMVACPKCDTGLDHPTSACRRCAATGWQAVEVLPSDVEPEMLEALAHPVSDRELGLDDDSPMFNLLAEAGDACVDDNETDTGHFCEVCGTSLYRDEVEETGDRDGHMCDDCYGDALDSARPDDLDFDDDDDDDDYYDDDDDGFEDDFDAVDDDDED